MRWKLIGGLAGVLVIVAVVWWLARPAEPEPQPEAPRLWRVEFLQIDSISVELPRAGLAEAWYRGDDRQWYFAPDGPRVDQRRWGGGIPMILTGPRSDRAIETDATTAELASYGLDKPSMRVRIEDETGERVDVEVGDPSPTGETYYLRRADSQAVFTIHRSWYEVLERLVTDPPYPEGDRL